MDRLKSLAIFKSVVDHGGFARAAAAMDLSPSVVTRCVKELEDLLGVRLLLRTTRSVALTSVGEAIFDRAAELLASYDELETFSSLSASEPHGRVRMAAPAAFGRSHLGEPLAAFRRPLAPVSVDLRLRDGPADMASDDADLVLCMGSDLRLSQIARELASIEVGLFASEGFLRAHGVPEAPQDLARFDCLLNRATRPATWSLIHRLGARREEVPVRAVLQASHDEVLMEAAAHGAGLVQLPVFMAEAPQAQGRIVRVLADWHAEPVSVHLTYASRRNQPLAVRKLIEHLVGWFREDAAVSVVGTLPAPPLRLVPDAMAA